MMKKINLFFIGDIVRVKISNGKFDSDHYKCSNGDSNQFIYNTGDVIDIEIKSIKYYSSFNLNDRNSFILYRGLDVNNPERTLSFSFTSYINVIYSLSRLILHFIHKFVDGVEMIASESYNIDDISLYERKKYIEYSFPGCNTICPKRLYKNFKCNLHNCDYIKFYNNQLLPGDIIDIKNGKYECNDLAVIGMEMSNFFPFRRQDPGKIIYYLATKEQLKNSSKILNKFYLNSTSLIELRDLDRVSRISRKNSVLLDKDICNKCIYQGNYEFCNNCDIIKFDINQLIEKYL